MRVLIAEDDPVSRTILKRAVEKFGHECLTAEDGESAWKLFQSAPEVDVVISDWMMPGVDGPELCRRIRQVDRTEYTFFIFLTVLGDKKHLLEGMQTGADDYLAKPLDGEQLQARLIAASRVTSLHRLLRQEIAERRRAEELRTAQMRYAQLRTEVSEVLNKGPSLQDTLQQCVQSMTRHLGAALARIWTFDSEQGVLELQASAGLYQGIDGPMKRVPAGKRIGHVFRSHRPYINNDILSDPRFEGKEWAKREGFVATANYPLVVEDQLVGAIALFAREPLPDHMLDALASVTDAIAQDIKRKQAEAELQRAEERYRTLVEQIPAVTYIQELADPGSNKTSPTMYASPQIEAQSGYTPEAFVEDPELWVNLMHPDDRERVLAEDERTDETGGPFEAEYRQIARDGRIVWIRDEAVLVRDEEGHPRFWQGVQFDITERKRAEEALRESEEKYRRLVELSPDAIVVHSEGHFVYVNAAGAELFGAPSPEELVGTPILGLVHPDYVELVEARVRHVQEEGTPTELAELKLVRFDGTVVDVETRGMPITYGDHPATQAVIRDVTERKRAEESLQEANRRLEELAALRTEFTAMVAHEIGSPLASVRGFLEVLATGELGPEEQTDILAKVRVEINRLSTLVADVRSAATIERDDFVLLPRQTSIDELFEDATRFAETLPGDHELITSKVEMEGRIWADRYRIGQVLRNLLSNAAKYSPDGTLIELRATPGETPGRIRIEVVDRGRGVHPDDVARIFEKFGRGRDRSGQQTYEAGLGLYLSRRIMRAHGSELRLDPAPKGGSVFSFELEETT